MTSQPRHDASSADPAEPNNTSPTILTGPLPPIVPGTANERPQHGFGPVLRNGDFVRLWSAQALSQMAQNTIWIALIAQIERITQSSSQVGLAIISGILPQMLLSGFAGVIVDRVNRKSVLVISNLLRVLVVIGYIFVQNIPPLIYVLTFLSQGISQFFTPAEAATIPALVPRRNLMAATSLFNLTYNAAQVVPFAVGLILLRVLGGLNGVMALVLVMYALAAALVSMLPSQPVLSVRRGAGSLREAAAHIWGDLAEGIHYIRRDRGLAVALVQINVTPTFLFVFSELGIAYVQRVIGLHVDSTYLLLIPAGVGLALGVLGLGRLGHDARKEALINLGLICMGVLVIVMGQLQDLAHSVTRISHALGHQPLTGILPPAMLIALLTGVAMALTTVPTQALVFEKAAPALRGRVLAMQQVIGGAIPIVPLMIVGPLADLFGVSTVLTGIGIVIFLGALVSIAIDRRHGGHGFHSNSSTSQVTHRDG